jgi:hypothetical protein
MWDYKVREMEAAGRQDWGVKNAGGAWFALMMIPTGGDMTTVLHVASKD